MQRNPYLYDIIPVGQLSTLGEPMYPITFPYIKTLVGMKSSQMGPILEVPKQIQQVAEEDTVQDNDLINLETVQEKVVVAEGLPTTLEEVRRVLDRVDAKKSGKKNPSFRTDQLKAIASALNLPTNGHKKDLVDRIRKAVLDFYNEKRK